MFARTHVHTHAHASCKNTRTGEGGVACLLTGHTEHVPLLPIQTYRGWKDGRPQDGKKCGRSREGVGRGLWPNRRQSRVRSAAGARALASRDEREDGAPLDTGDGSAQTRPAHLPSCHATRTTGKRTVRLRFDWTPFAARKTRRPSGQVKLEKGGPSLSPTPRGPRRVSLGAGERLTAPSSKCLDRDAQRLGVARPRAPCGPGQPAGHVVGPSSEV